MRHHIFSQYQKVVKVVAGWGTGGQPLDMEKKENPKRDPKGREEKGLWWAFLARKELEAIAQTTWQLYQVLKLP